MRAFIRGFFGLDWPYTSFTRSPHIYFIVVYLFRSTDDVSLSLIPLVHVVDQEETGSDPRGHLGVTWGLYLCAGKPPLADIILFHPPDLTRCDSVIGLAIPAMSGHIQYRGAASGDLYIRISGINRVLLSQCFRNFPAFRSDGQCIGDCQLARHFALTDWLTVISRYFGGNPDEGSDFISKGFVVSAIF